MTDAIGGHAAQYRDTGSDRAFEAVLAECEPLIARYARWTGSDREDAAQELRMCVVEAIRDWDGRRPFMAFCSMVLYYNAVNLLGRHSRRTVPVSLDAPVGHDRDGHVLTGYDVTPGGEGEPGESLELADDAKKALAVLDMHRIPRRKRMSFMYTAILGWTYAEAAKKLKCNRKRIDNDRQWVRKILRHDHAV